MPTSIENYIFNELPRRLVLDSSIATGSSLTASWVLVATGVGTQAIPTDPATLGFEPEVTPPDIDPGIKFWNGNKDWAEISAAAIGAIPSSEKGQALGVATLDADGYVQLSQMNPAVIERVVVVADEAARYALTIEDVQNGDVVNQQSPAPESMWYVVDQANLDNLAGYLPFSAGVAASVAWSGITGKPAIIGDLESITLSSEGDVLQYVGGVWTNVDTATLKASLLLEIADVDQLQGTLDDKQYHSTILDNVSAINTTGIIVRDSYGNFLGRELVGANGISINEPKGEADNPTILLTETGTSAGTYGDEFGYPIIEVDAFGRSVSLTTQTVTRNPIQILDVSTTSLQANTEHIFGSGIATYTSSISLELPDNVPGGTWVKIKCGEDFVQVQGSVTIVAPAGKAVQGDPSFPFSSYFKLYPFGTVDMVYSSSTSNWTVLTNATSFISSLHVARQGATDGVSNSHEIISNATSPRSLSIPDRDVDLSSVGQTDFADNVFRVSDNSDATKKIAFEASGIATGQVRTITMPNADVDLGLVGKTDFADNVFRVYDNLDPTKKVAIEASSVGTGQVRTITMPNADVDLGNIAQAASTSTTGYLTSADWNTFNGKQAALGSGTNIKTINGNNILGSGNLSLFTPRVSTVTNIAYTLQAADNDGNTYLRVDTASSATITIPSTQTTPITIRRATSQSVTLQGGSGVTLNGSLAFDVVGSTKSIIPIGTNQFDIVG